MEEKKKEEGYKVLRTQGYQFGNKKVLLKAGDRYVPKTPQESKECDHFCKHFLMEK